MTTPVRSLSYLVVCVASMVMLASVVQAQSLQDVSTWHNDMNRTGWQSHENTLTPTSLTVCNTPCFGLLWQYAGTQQYPMGKVYAQPLAVGGLNNVNGCNGTCSLVFVADSNDNIFAFNAASNTLVWNVNLAAAAGGSVVNCSNLPLGYLFAPCESDFLSSDGTIGIIGTPVIDTSAKILYVAAPIYDPLLQIVNYSLFAVDIPTHSVNYVHMQGSMPGKNAGPNSKCFSTYPSSGTLQFNPDHVQRAALLLLQQKVYVAFAPSDSEWESGWILSYSYTPGGGFVPGPVFSPTPYGTGGGIWASGAGPASDGNYIYVGTGNGTWDVVYTHPADVDFADSILQLSTVPVNGVLPIHDFYTPPNILTYQGDNGTGLCINDMDVGSGGVMVFPEPFFNQMNLLVGADKQSNLYFENLSGLGGFNAGGGNNVQTLQTPANMTNPPGNRYPQLLQGYWGSPAYWKYVDSQGPHYFLYYAATSDPGPKRAYLNTPYPIYRYTLATSGSQGPIPPSVNSAAIPTTTLFCPISPTPSISSSGTSAGSGILWAIENQNMSNPTNCELPKGMVALHAYDAANPLNELFNGRLVNTQMGKQTAFPVPTVFQSRVYVGTSTEVDVFGLCNVSPNPPCLQ